MTKERSRIFHFFSVPIPFQGGLIIEFGFDYKRLISFLQWFTIIYFVQVTEGPVLCVQRCEAQAKSNNNKPAARVAQSSQDRQEGNTGL